MLGSGTLELFNPGSTPAKGTGPLGALGPGEERTVEGVVQVCFVEEGVAEVCGWVEEVGAVAVDDWSVLKMKIRPPAA